MLSRKLLCGSFVGAMTLLTTATSAYAACAYVNAPTPVYLCNPHKAESAKDCQVVTRYASSKDLFYVLWLEGGLFGTVSMYYLKNVDNAREVGWVYASRVALDPPCQFRSRQARARKR